MKKSIFRHITLCSLLKVNRRFGGTSLQSYGSNKPSKIPALKQVVSRPALTLVSYSAYSTLKMEVICSSEILVDFQRNTWRYIQEDSSLHKHRCENLKSYVVPVMSTAFSRTRSAEYVTECVILRNVIELRWWIRIYVSEWARSVWKK
jgi:hypothetical protein